MTLITAKPRKVRELIKRDFERAFDLKNGGVDAIISPVSPSAAFKIGEKANDPLKMYLEDIFTAPAKMAGLPAMSVPSRLNSASLPIGLQIVAPRFGENLLFEIGKNMSLISQETKWLNLEYLFNRLFDWLRQFWILIKNLFFCWPMRRLKYIFLPPVLFFSPLWPSSFINCFA